MDDFRNIAIASTIVIGISEHAQKFGLPKKYLPLLNLFSSIVVSFFFVGPFNTKDFIISIFFLIFTSNGMNAGMSKLGKKLNKSKKQN